MARAIVLAKRVKKEKAKRRPFAFPGKWLESFAAVEISIEQREISEGFILYFIGMPHPDEYLLKNKYGRKKTLQNWIGILKENHIGNYLLDNTLTAIMEGSWDSGHMDLLKESLERKVNIFLSMEPLNNMICERMSITVTGLKDRYKSKELWDLLRKFRNVNIIEDGGNSNWWEDFMTETGVPVCNTSDFGVLERSDVWLSFDENNPISCFHGVKLDIPEKKIIYGSGKNKKQYRAGYSFPQRLVNMLGTDVIRRFGYDMLSNFLLSALMEERGNSLDLAENTLGLKIVMKESR